MNTYFAPPERLRGEELNDEIDIVAKSLVISGLLHSVSGLLAILNEQRQIVALNDTFLKMLGIDDPANILGIRPGEAVQCIHANDEPAGCGTAKFCSTCGAAIAIVSSLEQDMPVERICALSINKDNKAMDMALLVKSHPIKIGSKNFLLLFLQDVTLQQQRAALERTFFHDINNTLNMLLQASELLLRNTPSELAEIIYQTAIRLNKEVAIQRCLSETETSIYQPMWHEFKTEQIFRQLQSFFANHPSAIRKNIDFQADFQDVTIKTDISALLRVLCNMVLNALEASGENSLVKIWVENEDKRIVFCVWNGQAIPHDVSLRIFQRNFSTKKNAGRGIGTYSMKLFGEKILGGQVSFTTSPAEGTIFRFAHPI